MKCLIKTKTITGMESETMGTCKNCAKPVADSSLTHCSSDCYFESYRKNQDKQI